MSTDVFSNMLKDFDNGLAFSNAAKIDFDLTNEQKIQNFYFVLKTKRYDVEFLNNLKNSLGDGPKITELITSVANIPYPNVIYQTIWDSMPKDPLDDSEWKYSDGCEWQGSDFNCEF